MSNLQDILSQPENSESSLKEDTSSSETSSLSTDLLLQMEATQAENAELKDRILRTLAEMENLRRRTEKEVQDAKTYGISSFARDMLTFADNLSRALDMMRQGEAKADTFFEGLELIERDFMATLTRHGIRKLSPEGEKFDPHLHEALFEEDNPSLPAGTILQVVEAGYVIKDRVLRPAKVSIARGGPKNGEMA